jgi:hypothetical protein
MGSWPMKEPRSFQPGDEVEVVRDRGWTPCAGKEFATLLYPQQQFGAGMWMIRYTDGRQDTVHERRFTLDVEADGAVA